MFCLFHPNLLASSHVCRNVWPTFNHDTTHIFNSILRWGTYCDICEFDSQSTSPQVWTLSYLLWSNDIPQLINIITIIYLSMGNNSMGINRSTIISNLKLRKFTILYLKGNLIHMKKKIQIYFKGETFTIVYFKGK